MERYSPSADGGVVILGNLLVGFLGTSVGRALDSVGDVVSGVVDLVHVEGVCLVVDLVGFVVVVI